MDSSGTFPYNWLCLQYSLWILNPMPLVISRNLAGFWIKFGYYRAWHCKREPNTTSFGRRGYGFSGLSLILEMIGLTDFKQKIYSYMSKMLLIYCISNLEQEIEVYDLFFSTIFQRAVQTFKKKQLQKSKQTWEKSFLPSGLL